jgi:hypothetical protein
MVLGLCNAVAQDPSPGVEYDGWLHCRVRAANLHMLVQYCNAICGRMFG